MVKKQADRVERLIVRAPARGRVQQVLQRSPGEVVRPGETIVRIVPQDDALVAEVFVKPDDIAAVKVNDKAELKITAYDFSKYGKIKGEVKAISPTTTENEDKRSYYKVMVRFDARSLRPIHGGMAVEARDDGRCRNHLRQQVAAAIRLEADLSRGRCGVCRALSELPPVP